MIPFILGGLSLGATLFGIKKGYDANVKNKNAEHIVERAYKKFNRHKHMLEHKGKDINKELEEFAKFKLDIFMREIKDLVQIIKNCKKSAKSTLDHENITFTPEEVKILERSVEGSVEIYAGVGKGLTSGALSAFGAYGSVSMLATASTGTAISTLSGVAAENAILAWLGGGSIAAGGGGIALGTTILTGLMIGPAIAITGLSLDSRAEKNLTKAKQYEKDANSKINKMIYSIERLNAISQRKDELQDVISKLTHRFDEIYKNIIGFSFIHKIKSFIGFKSICKNKELDKLLILGKSLKMALDISILDENGNLNKNFTKEIKRIKIT